MSELTWDAIEAEIHALIRKFSTAENLTIDPAMTFDQLNVSSLDILQIVFRLEEHHGISIDTEGFYAVKTVNDIVEYIWRGIEGT